MKGNIKNPSSNTNSAREFLEQISETNQNIWQKFDLDNIKFIFNDDLSREEMKAVLAALLHILEE